MSNMTLASIILSEQSVSSLEKHQEAAEFFANGGTIRSAAMQYASSADTFFHRGLVWIIQSGFNTLPANERGKAPSIKQDMEIVSLDSKNAARAMLQEIYSLAWQATQKSLDPLEFASLRAMRDGLRTKDREVTNPSTAEGLASDEQAPEQAPVKLAVASEDVAKYLEQESIIAMLLAELKKAKPSIATLRKIAGLTVDGHPTTPAIVAERAAA